MILRSKVIRALCFRTCSRFYCGFLMALGVVAAGVQTQRLRALMDQRRTSINESCIQLHKRRACRAFGARSAGKKNPARADHRNLMPERRKKRANHARRGLKK